MSARATVFHPSFLVSLFALAAVLPLTGCGTGTLATGDGSPALILQGVVHGGQQPVQGTIVEYFATTSAGYNGTLSPIGSGTTATDGSFAITVTGTCPSGQFGYLVVTGGNPGTTAGTNNTALLEAAAIGPCSSITNTTTVTVNEVTTVAFAYALSGFLPAGGAGITYSAIAGGGAMPGVTTSATNTQGLTDAFGNAANIVNVAAGTAYTATPAMSSVGVVPQATIYALADILQDCVNATGPTATPCGGSGKLFAEATPPVASGLTAPANTLQAAINIARYPGNNVAALFGIISSQAAFVASTPLSAAPNDWTLGITYTFPGSSSNTFVSTSGLGVNAQDQVYVAGSGYLIDFSPQGAPLTTTSLLAKYTGITSSDSLREIQFDKSGNLFVTDGAYTGVYEYTESGNVVPLNFDVAPVSETNNNTYGITIDGLNDVWTSSYSKATCASVTCPLVEFAGGTIPAYDPFKTFSGYSPTQPTGALGGSRGMAFDVKTGNIWITAIDDNLAEVFNVTPSATGAATASAGPVQVTGLGTEAGTPSSNTAYGSIAVAVDSTSRAWIVIAGGPAVTGSKATATIPGAIYPVTLSGSSATVGAAVTGGGLNTPTQIVVDGNNNLFIANGSGSATASAVVAYSPAMSTFLSPATGFIPSSTGVLYEPSYLQIDRSGAIWTLSSGSGTTHPANLLQILGVAAPTDPVLANGNYGVKP